jgi:hypothetical protein
MRPSRSLLINAVGVVVLVAALVVVGRLGPGNQGAQHSSRPASGSTQRPVSLPDHPTTTLPSPVVAKISVGGQSVEAVAAGPGVVWAVAGCDVWRIDSNTNLVVAKVAGTGRKGLCVRGLAVGAGAVWGAVPGVGVVRIDPRGNRVVAVVPVGPMDESIAVGAGGMWVACCGQPVPDGGRTGLIRVDPAANRVVSRISLPGRPDAVGVSRGGVWVRAARGPVWHVDPARNQVVATIRVPGGLGATRGGIAVTSEAVWVSDPANGTLLQLDPERHRVVEGWEAAGRASAVVGEVVWTAGDGGLVGFGRGRVRPVQAEEVHADAVAGLAVGSGALWAATPSGLLRMDLRRLH